MLSRNSRFFGCDIDTHCFKELLYGVKEVIATRILNERSYIIGEVDVPVAEKILVSSFDRVGAEMKRKFWDAPHGLRPCQSFPAQITHVLSHCFRDPSLNYVGKALLLS